MEESIHLITDLVAAARKAGADAADALYYDSTSLSVSRRQGKPEGLERAESRGIGLRVFVGSRAAVVSSSDTGKDALSEILVRAIEMAKLAPVDPDSTLAPEARLAKDVRDLDLYDSKEPTPQWLQEQCAKAEDAALAVKGVTNSEGADAGYGTTHFALATSHGFAKRYKTSHASISVSVLAGTGTEMERDYDFTSARHITDLCDAETIGSNAGKKAVKRVHPRKVQTQAVPVVFDPRVSKGLVSAFAGAINGSAIARGTSFLKDAMETKIFSDSVRITDDPLRTRGLASRPFDGEGVEAKKLTLIENGVLTTWLLDVRSANKLGLETTGSASRGLSSPPHPSTTNLTLEAGKISAQDLVKDVKNGFYVTDLFGMGVNLVTGDYSQGASGFWIENGEQSYPVSEVTIAGKLQDMFKRLTPANDLEFRYGTNAPTVLVEGMMVAGR